jgi:UDP-glucose-4-epimerase GalE
VEDPLRVLLTGGAGYIGSFIADQLYFKGHEVVVLDNLSTGRYVGPSVARFVLADLRDRTLADRVIREIAPEAVIHLAALKSSPESIESPNAYFHNNVAGFANLLAGLEGPTSPPILLSSSCAVYGAVSAAPVGEDASVSPQSPYGESKAFCERMATWHATRFGNAFAALRYFNVGGARDDGSLGDFLQAGSTQLLPACVHAAWHGTPVPVHGWDYDTPDGTAVRDFVHVEDVAAAHVLVLEGLKAGGPGGYFNVGSGYGTSVQSIIRLFEQVSGRSLKVDRRGRRPGDPGFVWAKTDRIYSAYGFQAGKSVAQLVQSEWDWALSRSSGVTELDPWSRVRRRLAEGGAAGVCVSGRILRCDAK